MIRAITNVLRGEGLRSAITRARERIDEALHPFPNARDAAIVNVAYGTLSPRNGGVAAQLVARLRVEREMREVIAVECLPSTAKVIHVEGTSGVPLDDVLRFKRFVVSVHDFSLLEHRRWREVLDAAVAVVFPSRFLCEQYGVPRNAHVIAPGVTKAATAVAALQNRTAIAYAGSVKTHKGGALLPEIARGVDVLHVFGGGDVELLRPLRRMSNVVIHGYYRSGSLPLLLAQHRVGRVLLPSLVPESYSMTLSEAWMAGASVVAFDHGAIAERIREHGGGALAPLGSGAAGLLALRPPPIEPRPAPTPHDAARAMIELYRGLGILQS